MSIAILRQSSRLFFFSTLTSMLLAGGKVMGDDSKVNQNSQQPASSERDLKEGKKSTKVDQQDSGQEKKESERKKTNNEEKLREKNSQKTSPKDPPKTNSSLRGFWKEQSAKNGRLKTFFSSVKEAPSNARDLFRNGQGLIEACKKMSTAARFSLSAASACAGATIAGIFGAYKLFSKPKPVEAPPVKPSYPFALMLGAGILIALAAFAGYLYYTSPKREQQEK